MARRRKESRIISPEIQDQLNAEVLDAALERVKEELRSGTTKVKPEMLVGAEIQGVEFTGDLAQAAFDLLVSGGQMSKTKGKKGKYRVEGFKTSAAERASTATEEIERMEEEAVLSEAVDEAFQADINDKIQAVLEQNGKPEEKLSGLEALRSIPNAEGEDFTDEQNAYFSFVLDKAISEAKDSLQSEDNKTRQMIDNLIRSQKEGFADAINDEERKSDIEGVKQLIQEFERGQGAYAVSEDLKNKAISELNALKDSFEASLKSNSQSSENTDEKAPNPDEIDTEIVGLPRDDVDTDYARDEVEEEDEVIERQPNAAATMQPLADLPKGPVSDLEGVDFSEEEEVTLPDTTDDTDELLKEAVNAKQSSETEVKLDGFGVPVDQEVVRPDVIAQIKAQKDGYVERFAVADAEKKKRMVEKSESRKAEFEAALADEDHPLRQMMTEAEIDKSLFYIDAFLRKANQEQINSQTEGFVEKGFEEDEVRQEKIDEYKDLVDGLREIYDASEDTAQKQRIIDQITQQDSYFDFLQTKEGAKDPKRMELSLAEIAAIGAMFKAFEEFHIGLSPEDVERLQSEEKEIGELPKDTRKEPALGLDLKPSAEKNADESIDPGSFEIPDRDTDEKELKERINANKEATKEQQEPVDTKELKEKVSNLDLAKAVAKGLFTAGLSLTGARLPMMTVRYLMKRGGANRDLRALNLVLESEKNGERDPMQHRYERLRGVISRLESKTDEEKQELLNELEGIFKERDLALKENAKRTEREMAKLFSETVPVHITETWGELARESLNTATGVAYLTGFGLAAAAIRPAAYTAISGAERFVTVRQEMAEAGESGPRKFAKKYVVDGFTETMKNAVGRGEAEGKLRKGLDAVSAWSTIGRTIGLGSEFAIGAGYEQLKQMAENGPTKEQLDDLLNGALKSEGIDYESVIKDIPEISQVSDVDSVETVVKTPTGGTVFESPKGSMEVSREISREMVETGRIQETDTIVGVMQRQIEANAQEFGYTGDMSDQRAVEAWSASHALEIARGTGIIDGDRDLRLSTEAIQDVSLVVTPDQGIRFLDSSGNEIDPDTVTYWGYSGGAAPSAGEVDMLARSPREGLLRDAFEDIPDAATAEEVAPGIEMTTLSSDAGVEKQFEMEGHGSMKFRYDAEGQISGMEMSIKPPREIYESVYDLVGDSRALDSDQSQYIDGVATQLYLLGEYERAGMEGTPEYAYLKKAFRQFIRENNQDVPLDLENPLFKDYLEGLDVEAPRPEAPAPSEVIAASREQDLTAAAAVQEQIPPQAMQMEGRLDMIRLNGNRGDVVFKFGTDGEIDGIDYSGVKFGIFARASMVDLVEQRSYVPEDMREGFVAPKGQMAARTEIARKLYALRVTEEALENSGVEFNDPRRRFIHDQALREVRAFNEEWIGVQRVNIGGTRFRSLGI